MGNEPRTYTDEEFAQVLHTALRLQEKGAPRQLTAGSGLTLDEMKSAAGDAGIDPALIERAAALLPSVEGSGGRLLGGPTRYRLACSVPGAATREELMQTLDAIRDVTGLSGDVSAELDGVSWKTKGEPSEIHVSIFPGDEGTEVRVAVNRSGAAFLTLFVPMAGSFFLSAVTLSALEPDAVPVVVGVLGSFMGGGAALARVLWGRSARIIRERANHVLDTVTRVLS